MLDIRTLNELIQEITDLIYSDYVDEAYKATLYECYKQLKAIDLTTEQYKG